MIEHVAEVERALLVGVEAPGTSPGEAAALLAELANLAKTIGLSPVGRELVRIKEISPKYYLGSGKAAELSALAADLEADVIVFDSDLSPSQQRNWEKLSDLPALDRPGVILEIFADRAQTKEAILQVDLAQLEYFLPRLTNAWSHLSRQRGGRRGTRGEGETQLEMDRRLVQQRIASIRRELKNVSGNRALMRKQRSEVPLPTGSIVGYTNAGKSSLIRALTGSDVHVADKLFATLDPATRRLELHGGQAVLLTDTVGFIRRLPHGLVEAFKSTLEETVLAGFLIHVVDASDLAANRQAEVTTEVLSELGAGDKPRITVLNKVDRIDDQQRDVLLTSFPDAIPVSAVTGVGLPRLLEQVQSMIAANFSRITVALPHDRYDLAALIHRTGRVLEEVHHEVTVRIDAEVPERTRQIVERYSVAE